MCGSPQNIPADTVLRDDGNAWVSSSGDEVKTETEVRLKILSSSVQVTHLVREGGTPGGVALCAPADV